MTTRELWLTFACCFLLSLFPARAGTFLSDFNSGLPANAKVYGTARVEATDGTDGSGVLKLISAKEINSGSFIIEALDGTNAISGFTATFKARIGGGDGADGFALSFGPDLPDEAFGEHGIGSGLIVTFDTFSNPDPGAVPAGVLIYFRNELITNVLTTELRAQRFVDVSINVGSDGTVNVSYDGMPYIIDLVLPEPMHLAGRFALSARTGGFKDDHFVDDLSIVTDTKPPRKTRNVSHGIVSTVTGRGYWIFSSDGEVVPFGDAKFFGSWKDVPLTKPVVGMAARPQDDGYWLVTSDGAVFSFGAAFSHGYLAGKILNQPIIGMASAADGEGYWLVARDGGVFSYGSARFKGGTGDKRVSNIVGLAATSTNGYWLLGADGMIYNFGTSLNDSVPDFSDFVGIAATSTGDGYWLLRGNGEVHGFNAPTSPKPAGELVATSIARGPANKGYWIISRDGEVHAFGEAKHFGDMNTAKPDTNKK